MALHVSFTRSSTRFGAIARVFALSAAVLGFGCQNGESAPPATAASTPSNSTNGPADDAPLTDPPAPPKATGNPLQGVKLWVDPESLSALRANAIRASEPDKAAILDRIGKQPQALWLGEWNVNVFRTVQHVEEKAREQNAVPVFVAYNVPGRDCGSARKDENGNWTKSEAASAGGLQSNDAYRHWIRKVAAGIGQDAAVVILEPDALPLLDKCLTPAQQEERLALFRDAVRVLRQNPKTIVYVDAGHSNWQPAEVMAERLKKAGVAEAHGFSLNTSNYGATDANLEYGKKLSGLLNGAHFVIDTSRNGAGPDPKAEWCNPPGRKIGKPPTTETGEPLADAFLWLKRPGESDGECNGGPRAGVFWMEKALELAQ
jgi:endoglucanase